MISNLYQNKIDISDLVISKSPNYKEDKTDDKSNKNKKGNDDNDYAKKQEKKDVTTSYKSR